MSTVINKPKFDVKRIFDPAADIAPQEVPQWSLFKLICYNSHVDYDEKLALLAALELVGRNWQLGDAPPQKSIGS